MCSISRKQAKPQSSLQKNETGSNWVIDQWRQSLGTKLTNRAIGSKDWWSLVKQRQGLTSQDCIAPLYKPDGNVATSNQDKA